jgi:hypothetical protein
LLVIILSVCRSSNRVWRSSERVGRRSDSSASACCTAGPGRFTSVSMNWRPKVLNHSALSTGILLGITMVATPSAVAEPSPVAFMRVAAVAATVWFRSAKYMVRLAAADISNIPELKTSKVFSLKGVRGQCF